MERTRLIGIAHAERQRLGRTIQYASPESWEAASPCEGWTNRDIACHLAAQDTAAAQLVAGGEAEEFAAFRVANGGELWVSGFNEWAVGVRRERQTRDVLTDWGRAADAMLASLVGMPDDAWGSRRVPWVAGDIGVRYLLQSRIVEWWLHGEDIRQGSEQEENPQHWPVFLVNDLAVRMLPWALSEAGFAYPGSSLRIDLEGVGGGTWHWGLGARELPSTEKKPDAFIQGRALTFALVAGRRRTAEWALDRGDLVVGGEEEIAFAALESLRAFVD